MCTCINTNTQKLFHALISPIHITHCFASVLSVQVAFSHFGDMLVSSGGDFKVILWNLKDFTVSGLYDAAMAPVSYISPTASQYASAKRREYILQT